MAKSQPSLKRKAPNPDENNISDSDENINYKSDEIQVAPPPVKARSGREKPRKAQKQPLQEIQVNQPQSKRRRVVAYVLIPVPKSPLTSSSRPSSSASSVQSYHTAPNPSPAANSPPPPAETSLAANTSRPKRYKPRISYAAQPELGYESEDELPSPRNAPVKRSKSQAKVESRATSDVEYSNPSESEGAENSEEDDLNDMDSSVSEELSSDEAAPKKKTTRAPTAKAKAQAQQTKSSGSNATGKSKTKGTKKNMENLANRQGKLGNGLDLSLPPLSQIDDIFADLTKKALDNGLEPALEHLKSRTIRVATMCSGTESPLLALDMIREALKTSSDHALNIEHLFSAEIVPYKQAYIKRNFDPPIIFRDITELKDVIHDPTPMATTAYGAKVPVPKDVDIVIAGTSCVDFSGLNNKKKGLTEGGESGKTWDAVFAFCKEFRPAIVLLENVFGAPWDDMLREYESIGYESCGALVDTKDYYIPHTRQRGFMACFDKDRTANSRLKTPGELWKSLMGTFRRRASSPVSSFLLPISRIRPRDASRIDGPKRDVDWVKCEITQLQYRIDNGLGDARPFSNWQESGTVLPPENASKSWHENQADRVLDTEDCALLRKALEMYDVRFKCRIWDLSQNVYMNQDATPFGVTGCLTPAGQFFISDASRALLPEESLILQGLPLHKILLTTETASDIQNLAGNAMTTTVIGSSILASLIAGYDIVGKPGVSSNLAGPKAQKEERKIINGQSKSYEYTSGGYKIDTSELLTKVKLAIRRCYCEGSNGRAAKPIQECLECHHTTCTDCGGNPQHNYRQQQDRGNERVMPQDFEAELRSKLPLQLTLDLEKLGSFVAKGKNKSTFITDFLNVGRDGASEAFSMSHFRRTHCLTVVYLAQRGRLELVLDDTCAEWRFYATAPKHLASNDPLRAALAQPMAKSRLSNNLLSSQWKWRIPTERSVDIQIRGHGEKQPTWWARLQMPDFRDHVQWQELTISLVDSKDRDHQLEGTYVYLPRCGTACESLYQKVCTEKEEQPLYLFLDPTRVGEANEDSFVFSTNKALLEYDEVRSVIGRIHPSWRPWDQHKSNATARVTFDGDWTDVNHDAVLRSVSTTLTIREATHLSSQTKTIGCQQLVGLISCEQSNRAINPNNKPANARTVDGCIQHDQAWIFEAMRRQLSSDKWRKLKNLNADTHCTDCAPPKPDIKWNVANNGETIVPYEDPEKAAEYERAMGRRSPPILATVREVDEVLRAEIGLDLLSLAHRARSHLPQNAKGIVFQWKLDTNAPPKFSLKPFTLRPSRDTAAHEEDLAMTVQLFPEQKMSLAWMIKQEAGAGCEFDLEETEEATVPGLPWRIEMRARSAIHVRGGICADHPGFGKTIKSLALIQAQCLASTPDEVKSDLQARQADVAPGLLVSTATLIICPQSLINQWCSEVRDKLPQTTVLLKIVSHADLAKYSIADFQSATIIVACCKIFDQEAYVERLAAFAAIPGPVAVKGRPFTQWLDFASKQIPDHLRLLEDIGEAQLKKALREKYNRHLNSESFKSFIPSRRLRGKDLADAEAQKTNPKSRLARPASASLDTKTVGSPLFQMFYWNRLIVDEFHLIPGPEYQSIKALNADKRWGLSGTPALGDLYDIAEIASLLGIPLSVGNDARGMMKLKNINNLKKDQTKAEEFSSMLRIHSDSLQSRIYELDQKFLDSFVRRDIANFGHISCTNHIVPVSLDSDHLALYTELSTHLNSLSMRIRKSSKSKDTDREKRLYQALSTSKSAEEALSKIAACFHLDRAAASSGLEYLMDLRREDALQRLQKAKSLIADAQAKEPETYEKWRVTLERKGDEETVTSIQAICKQHEGSQSVKAKPTKSKKRKSSDTDKQAAGSDADAKDKEEAGRELTAQLNNCVTRLLVCNRSSRFLKSVQTVQVSAASKKLARECDSEDCRSSSTAGNLVAISAFCGHIICKDCYEHMKKHAATECRAEGCSAAMQDHNLLWSNKMKETGASKPATYGAKIAGAMDILEKIKNKGEQAILFVQFKGDNEAKNAMPQMDEVETALKERGIAATIVRHPDKAGPQIDDFRDTAGSTKKHKTVIVLNASDETAAGLNLQNANHVIFLSPLLCSSQWGYDSTMAQTIGRVRRHGQKKQIHVYRILALDTIDVDILEARERRTDALVQQGALPIARPPGARQLFERGIAVAERTQLVQDKDGNFSLQPQSWLVSSGSNDNNASEMAKVKGKSRVGGWEDFSSLVKFSKGFGEDD